MIMLDPMYEKVTRGQHEEEMRRARESTLVRETRRRKGTISLLHRLIGRGSSQDERSLEGAGGQQTSPVC